MSELTDLSLHAMLEGLEARQFSALELTDAHLAAMEAARPLGVFLTETPDAARAAARAADEARAAGRPGRLAGVPVANKDLFATAGTRTTAGSRILEGFFPPYESGVTARLLAEGAVPLGKTAMDEFGMGSSTENSAFGPVVSPWRAEGDDRPLSPGGSSGGSSAAVAAGLAPIATGTDTGGSIRQPAAFTGLVGMKPSYGRCSRWGQIAFASSLDQAGIFARDVAGCALAMELISGHDARDATSLPVPVPPWAAMVDEGVAGRTVGLPRDYRADGMDPLMARLWDEGARALEAAGARLVEVSLPHTSVALPCYYIIAPAEASSNLARYDGVRYGPRLEPEGASLDQLYEATRAAGFGREVKRRVLIGTYVLSAGYYDAYYLQASRVRALIARDFARAFETSDLLLVPTAPTGAFALGEKTADPLAMYWNDVFTVPASLAGLPALSMPAGPDARGLPLGLQLIGPAQEEARLFQAGRALERALAYAPRPGRWWAGG